LALKIVVMTKEQGGGSNPHWDGLPLPLTYL